MEVMIVTKRTASTEDRQGTHYIRSDASRLKIAENQREDGPNEKIIEGYFAVYGDIYEIWPGATESIARGAFASSISGDIRALINHDTSLVVGRTKPGTLTLRDDERGLWGRIMINDADTDALNLYARVMRGDVDGCSIGFCIKSETVDFRDDGTIHWTIEEIDPLFEVSVVTFPAYEETNVTARRKEYDEMTERKLQARKEKLRARLKKEDHENGA
jgi:uncharacterized protein